MLAPLAHNEPERLARKPTPGADTFDPDYTVDLSKLVGDRPAGDLFMVSDRVALIRARHADLISPIKADISPIKADKSSWQDVLNEAEFLWWRWPLGSDKASLRELRGQCRRARTQLHPSHPYSLR